MKLRLRPIFIDLPLQYQWAKDARLIATDKVEMMRNDKCLLGFGLFVGFVDRFVIAFLLHFPQKWDELKGEFCIL